ncbi:hypothetical protein [Paraburkholderia youngii]|uniref:hypothetical protein n=1 Tax=Paraburkholderia youngii TaxID=2782701 RepID=UPI003D1EA3E6
MTRAATLFLKQLNYRLDTMHPLFLASGNSARELAREFSGGLPAMLAALEKEAAAVESTPGFPGLNNLLMEAWTRRGDDEHLTNATGHDRQWWLDVPIWTLSQ